MPKVVPEVHAAGRTVAERYTPELRVQALESNWPPNLAARLGVRFTEQGQFAVSVDGKEDIPDEILDQEFGTAESGPKSAIGNFFLDEIRRNKMRRDLHKELLGYVRSWNDALRGH